MMHMRGAARRGGTRAEARTRCSTLTKRYRPIVSGCVEPRSQSSAAGRPAIRRDTRPNVLGRPLGAFVGVRVTGNALVFVSWRRPSRSPVE